MILKSVVTFTRLQHSKVTHDCSFSIMKEKVKNYVVETVQHIVFGDPEEIFEMLGVNSGGYIGTSYVERINLTIRTSLARFIRKTMNFSKTLKMHQKAFDLFQAWYNFI